MPRNLTINPAPFKSSNLAIPPSPFSPKSPVSPVSSSPPRRSTSLKAKAAVQATIELTPPPTKPLHWLWQCHICNRVYQLGVTRRCLDDGHLFCAGTTTVKRSRRTNKKVIRHKACASEFDYQGWKTWGTWRRSVIEQAQSAAAVSDSENEEGISLPLSVPAVPAESEWLRGAWPKKANTESATSTYHGKDCWNTCDYPSECRWSKQYGVSVPKTTVSVPSSLPPPPPVPEKDQKPKTTFDDILLDATVAEQSSAEQVEHSTEETTVAPEQEATQTKKPSMDDLLESAKRRKRRSMGATPSPLGSNPPSPTTSDAPASAQIATPSTASYLQKAFDDFELDVKKSFERAGDLVTIWASSIRSTAALEEEKAEAFVKGLKITKKKQHERDLEFLEERVGSTSAL